MKISKSLTNFYEVSNKGLSVYSKIDFIDINKKADDLANLIKEKLEELTDILLEYESFEVVNDEINRTLDLLQNLKENEEYFKLRVGPTTSFLPKNQPLYAFTCFVIIPSFMCNEVHFRIPHSMKNFFPRVLDLLEIKSNFPNIYVSKKERLEFLTERTALKFNPQTKETKPVTDVVIFTGTSLHAEQLRIIFDPRTLFITNGSGHNPVVIGADANLHESVEAVLKLQFYNQGQDCAAPNSILVHREILNEFLITLRKEIKNVKVGEYKDKKVHVGPISDPKDLVRIQNFLIENHKWIDASAPGIIRSLDAIVEPTLIVKPLKEGGNFTETFAPIVFVQEYQNDSDLSLYFEDALYAHNAMYVSVYGSSDYVKNLDDKRVKGKCLHSKSTIHHNVHLHENGVERGTQQYGGYGVGASSISIKDTFIAKPTLPQREIFEYIAKPILEDEKFKINTTDFSELQFKNVYKLLRMQLPKENNSDEGFKITDHMYFDLKCIKVNSENQRYLKLEGENISCVLDIPNARYISDLTIEYISMIRKLRNLLQKKSALSYDEFRSEMYAIPKLDSATEEENKSRQIIFFQHTYQLLFGKKKGPQLASFLLDVDLKIITKLLDI